MTGLILRLAFAGIKKLLSIGGGALVTDGILTSDQNSQAIGAVMTLVGIAWEAYQTWQTHKAAKPIPAPDVIDAAVAQAKAADGAVEVHQLPDIK
jgi:hypothetical protein